MNLICAFTLVAAMAGATCEPPPLCVNGRPAPRPADVTYGGFRRATPGHPCRVGELCCPIGTIRDHIVPLCIGGLDIPSNIQCQETGVSYLKDAVERQMCEAYCRAPDPIMLPALRNYEWWLHEWGPQAEER